MLGKSNQENYYMHNIQKDTEQDLSALQDIVAKMQAAHKTSPLSKHPPILVGASKGQDAALLRRFLASGLSHYGENRVQEAQTKWPPLRREHPELMLHLIGALQSNKAAEAVELFDVIETVDREKIAMALDKEMKRQNRYPPCFIQVNIGKEPQKAGVAPEQLAVFAEYCRKETVLPIVGLMCVPPADVSPAPYFALMHELARESGLKELSMGMSADYETAIAFGATQVRIGTALFGARVGSKV